MFPAAGQENMASRAVRLGKADLRKRNVNISSPSCECV